MTWSCSARSSSSPISSPTLLKMEIHLNLVEVTQDSRHEANDMPVRSCVPWVFSLQRWPPARHSASATHHPASVPYVKLKKGCDENHLLGAVQEEDCNCNCKNISDGAFFCCRKWGLNHGIIILLFLA